MAGTEPLTLLRGLVGDLDRLEAAAVRAAVSCSRARVRAAEQGQRASRAEQALSLLEKERAAVRDKLREIAGESPAGDA